MSPFTRASVVLAGCGLFATAASATTAPFRVVVPQHQSVPEHMLTSMLLEESASRTVNGKAPPLVSGRTGVAEAQQAGADSVVIGRRDGVDQLLPIDLRPAWKSAVAALHPDPDSDSDSDSDSDVRSEGFTVVSLPWHSTTVTVVAGNDARGELFGVGWLLRQMRFASGTPQIPAGLRTWQAPEKSVRGHQIGYRFKNNTYDAWTLAQFEEHIRELAIFGTNTIQVIAPNSDDEKTSPLYPAPALETVIGISALVQKYGLDFDLYYPEMRKDYSDPAAVEAELKDFQALVQALPQVDALYIPGGDPGHTPPEVLFPLVEREAAVLHRFHPRATIWISAQGFDQARYEAFYTLLARQPSWLTGVFFGPQSRDSFETQRRRIPQRYALQFYPDIAHTMHAQFPVPEWDPIWALTEGREPICPRPEAFAAIYRHYAALNTGFVTYSEGVNDDVNKMLWSQLGWAQATPVDTILAEYARWFLHREGEQQELAVQALHGLEQDWDGPIAGNIQIAKTRALFAQLEAAATASQIQDNGRWQSLLYRADYDDYVQRKLLRERMAESLALAKLDDTSVGDAAARVAVARAALANSQPNPREQAEHDQLFTLAGQLFHDWGLQLSVKLYGASNWERGANLDRVDTPLTERVWLESAMTAALQRLGDAAQMEALSAIARWRNPSPDAIYDDLGDPAAEPHLVRGKPWSDDPELYHAAIDGIADRTLELPWRLSWLDYAETLYEYPLQLRYTGLDPARHYRVRVTYAGEDYAVPLRLTANGVEVHPARLRQSNPETVEFALPDNAIKDGTLHLDWAGPSGSGGSGRGRQVAEVWLRPEKK